ncbi:hypothetical protein [Longimicrobium sp.]|jgi:hypothetical protein|uniref:hypothetical protein n=1 Tax=Longimicrobium sp. TaxID=2029185 RepID=UPI002ED9286C
MPLMMSGFDLQHRPTRTMREAARGSSDPVSALVSTGQVRSWDLLTLKSSSIPGASDWAERTLDAVVAAAATSATKPLDCADCEDVGFYGIADAEDTDKLVGLLRRVGENGYEQLVAGAWRPYETRYDQHVEVLSRDLAGDLAEALTAGATGLVRRYFWPIAFLPPERLIAAGPAPEEVLSTPPKAATEDVTAGPEDGWTEYAIVDELDTGAVLELIRLRPGPELLAYRNGKWDEAPEVLAQLQGVQPPPLVELDQAQLDNVLEQIGQGQGEAEGSEDSGDPGEGLDEADKTEPVAAAGEKKHTLPEGAFPIDNRDDLKKAVKALGRATNKNAAKRHIIKRARELNAVGVLPEDWGITAGAKGALVADAPLTVSPDPRAEKLRRYWTSGKGAAKIRWGTPGDWTRCYRQLRKYMGVRAKGYCQNLHKRATGQWSGARGNRTAGAVAASGRPAQAVLSIEAALVAAMSTGRWIGPGGESMTTTLKDGIYAEAGNEGGLLRTLTAAGFPVAPPDDWFADPQLEGPTPLTVDDDGRVYGHIATRDVAHIGLPGRVHAPKSRTDYAYFKTGQLVTASGKRINVGQLTLAGGHAPLQADAAAAVAHYDNTASAAADVNCGDDKWGIWVAGSIRPEVTPNQLRVLRASAPSGDWRPINGNLELVACCQVNVPGFPVTRARVASGAIMSLVAAGSRPLYAMRLAMLADAAVAERLTALEAHVYGVSDGPDLVGDESVVADGEPVDADASVTTETDTAEEVEEEETPAPEEKPVSEAVQRARALAAERRAAAAATEEVPAEEAPAVEAETPAEENVAELTPDEQERADRLAALRARVHGGDKQPVAASAGDPGKA